MSDHSSIWSPCSSESALRSLWSLSFMVPHAFNNISLPSFHFPYNSMCTTFLRPAMKVASPEKRLTLLLPSAKGHHQCGIKLSKILCYMIFFFKPHRMNLSYRLSLRLIFSGSVLLLPSWCLYLRRLVFLSFFFRGSISFIHTLRYSPLALSIVGMGCETCIRFSTLSGPSALSAVSLGNLEVKAQVHVV